MTAQVYIILEQAKDAIIIPATAINQMDGQGNATIRVVDEAGNVTQRKVKTGINNNVDVQILDGLKAGEKVIVSEASGSAQNQSTRMPRMRM